MVDWGLAKAAARGRSGSAADEHTLVPRRRAAPRDASPAAPLGTPAYMSPSKPLAISIGWARAPTSTAWAQRSTAFSPACRRSRATTSAEILLKVQRVTSPRLGSSIRRSTAAPEAVCLRRWRPSPEYRYAVCRALADDVERWLADEPVSAWVEPLRGTRPRWMRGTARR